MMCEASRTVEVPVLKTFFFSTLTAGEARTTFLRDHLKLLNLDSQKLGIFFHALPSLLVAEGDGLDNQFERVARDAQLNLSDIEDIFSCSRYVVEKVQQPKFSDDQPKDWAADLIESLESEGLTQKPASDRTHQIASEIASQLWRIAEGYKSTYLRRRYERGTLPRFERISSTVELRGIIENSRSDVLSGPPPEDDPELDRYRPSLVGLVGVASVHISTDNEDHHFFQMTEQDLTSAIRSLRATLHELRALQDGVTVKHT